MEEYILKNTLYEKPNGENMQRISNLKRFTIIVVISSIFIALAIAFFRADSEQQNEPHKHIEHNRNVDAVEILRICSEKNINLSTTERLPKEVVYGCNLSNIILI